ncbi:cytochrome c oxidase subunit 2 [Paenibacillus sp. DS2015]|uniref:cytochrome C oxidase subunit II n=1 Tax=Paenibacillus sp. DS2015 TaxID=3373917 RepID=UPI003D215596
MRKTLAIIISCFLILSLAACGGNNDNAAPTNSGLTETGVAPSEELVIKATNYNFDQKEYHLKKGVPVKIIFDNAEGNHGVLIPGLNLQLDQKNSSKVITPDKAGTYEITCSVFCGTGHTSMISKIIVE